MFMITRSVQFVFISLLMIVLAVFLNGCAISGCANQTDSYNSTDCIPEKEEDIRHYPECKKIEKKLKKKTRYQINRLY